MAPSSPTVADSVILCLGEKLTLSRTEIFFSGVGEPLEFLNGKYVEIGHLASDWAVGAEKRPLFEKQDKVPKDSPIFADQEIYLYYFSHLTCWAVSPTIGGDTFLAFSEGDEPHPALVHRPWNFATGHGFDINWKAVVTNGPTLVSAAYPCPSLSHSLYLFYLSAISLLSLFSLSHSSLNRCASTTTITHVPTANLESKKVCWC